MTTLVGTKGQVVIEKQIRDQLGVAPGWRALQSVAEDHVEIRFLPPEHNRSLAGCLADHVKRPLADGEQLHRATEAARGTAAKARHRARGQLGS